MKKFISFFLVFMFMCIGQVTFAQAIQNDSSQNSVSLENTPIDLVYCYADLRDPDLHRGKELDNSIKKDYDNDELRYSLRSVLQNMPWIRKIFIIMPNKKVRFLKEPEEISDKIVYVQNEDLLGFDTNSVFAKKFHLWKLKEFGCSNHIIYMDDDFFIGKPMEKSDFFYVDNNQVVPYVLYNKPVGYGQYAKIKAFNDKLRKDIDKDNLGTHSAKYFQYQQSSSWLFLYEFFNRDILMPNKSLWYFPHNAFAENLSENKEIYDIVKKHYKKQQEFLNETYRSEYSLVNAEVYNFYVLNKYNRKINNIPSAYIDLAHAKNHSFDYKLFCINTGGDRNYTEQEYSDAKLTMMKLFPHKTEYEKPDLPIHIAMATDNNYIFPAIVSMTSILENKNPNTKIDFYIMLSGDITQESKNKILSLQDKYSNCNITLINMKEKMKEFYTSGHIKTATYYRLMLPSLLPHLDKVLYLDVDIIVRKDLSELFNYNVDNFYLAGVVEYQGDNRHNRLKWRLSRIKDDFYMQKYGENIYKKSYINAGIAIFNLNKMRKDNIEPKLLECAKSYNHLTHDQCALNLVCYNKILNIPSVYNSSPQDNYDSNQVIVHYLGKNKPWSSPESKNADLWWEYAQKTDYFKEIQQKYVRDKVKT